MAVPARDTDRATAEAVVHCLDEFSDDRPPGAVIGSAAASGACRHGVDSENLISIDNGALRLRPLQRPGWRREGVAYGPVPRQPGLAFVAYVLNGHNTSQTVFLAERWRRRVRRWIGGLRRGRLHRPRHHENLAVGWFPSATPRDPSREGNGFVMHAASTDNGELWATVRGRPLRAVRGVQNLQILYVVALRERGAAYYAASVPGAFGLGDFPYLCPLAVDPDGADPEVWAGVNQRILGEVGYRVDTRVYSVSVIDVPDLGHWYGSAHLADRLDGTGRLAGTSADVGGDWWRWQGRFDRSSRGAVAGPAGAAALLVGDRPVGLVHLILEGGRQTSPAGVVWRASSDGAEAWRVLAGRRGCELATLRGGRWVVVATDDRCRTRPGANHSLQVVDNRDRCGIHLDGRLVFDRWFADERGRERCSAGIWAEPGFDGRLRRFEAHPEEVPLPDVAGRCPPWSAIGTVVAFDERFDGPAGDLALTPMGDAMDRRWERSEGNGLFERTGTGAARVIAGRDRPNPGRTLYTVPWPDPAFADLTVDLTHPGTRQHEGHAGRGGVVFWQDHDNHLVVNFFLDDTFDGASISSFYHLAGQEAMYDAVWTNVPGVTWGGRNTLRVAFDGMRFLAQLDGRPSLYRALTDVYPDAQPLTIRRVGLVANWEWGDDTGTVFHRFAGSFAAAAEAVALIGP